MDDIAVVQSKRLRNKISGFTTHLMKRIQVGPVRGISLRLQEEVSFQLLLANVSQLFVFYYYRSVRGKWTSSPTNLRSRSTTSRPTTRPSKLSLRHSESAASCPSAIETPQVLTEAAASES
jgi:hypothetical protein